MYPLKKDTLFHGCHMNQLTELYKRIAALELEVSTAWSRYEMANRMCNSLLKELEYLKNKYETNKIPTNHSTF